MTRSLPLPPRRRRRRPGRRREKKKGLVEMPVKWRESSSSPSSSLGKGSRSCPASSNDRYRSDGCARTRGAGVPCTLLPSGVLHNSSSVFLRRSSNPSPCDPLGSFSPRSSRGVATPPQQWVSSGIGNKLCSAKSARKMTKPRN